MHDVDVSTIRGLGLTTLARVVPKLDDKQHGIGYAVYVGRDRELLPKLGLRSGDIVTAVNGLSFAGSAEKGFLVGTILKDTSYFELHVQRGGAAQDIQIRLVGGTLADIAETLEPPADYDDAALEQLIVNAQDSYDFAKVGPNRYTFATHLRGSFAAQLAVGRRLRAYLDKNLRDGLPLTVMPDSWLAKLGFENGDVLAGIGSRDVRSLDDLATAFFEQFQQSKVEVRVRRGSTVTLVYEAR